MKASVLILRLGLVICADFTKGVFFASLCKFCDFSVRLFVYIVFPSVLNVRNLKQHKAQELKTLLYQKK